MMYPSWTVLSLVPLCIDSVLADFLLPRYPPPTNLAGNDSVVAASWQNVTSILNEYVHANQSTSSASLSGLENITFSCGMFSLHDPLAAENLQFHYTSPEITNSTAGTKQVNGDSIYRIASVSKLFTAYAAEILLSEQEWNSPIINFIPGLGDVFRQQSEEKDSVYSVAWDEVTLRALAAQISGIPRDSLPFNPNDVLLIAAVAQVSGSTDPLAIDPTVSGLPPLNYSDPAIVPPCLFSPTAGTCTVDEYLQALTNSPPTFLPWATPSYANNNYILLGLALSNITGMSLDDMYRKTLFEPLNLTDSNSTVPGPADIPRSVIAGDPAADFAVETTFIKGSGGLFSSINDLAKLGISILNSTILPPDHTRRWMKPVSHTANLHFSTGSPWEIYRYTHPATGVVSDIYTKFGDSGIGIGYEVLIPDYDAGFSVLAASTYASKSSLIPLVIDLITESIMPALEAQAALEARRNFAGTYVSTVDSLNSSLTLSLNESVPGLSVSSWISNDTDVLNGLVAQYFGVNEMRLIPSISPSGADRKIAFRGSPPTASLTGGASTGLFSGLYTRDADWTSVDAITYGGVGLSLFVFDVDDDGNATAVSPSAFRVQLDRTGRA